jgi:hypothetical protein
MEPKGSLPRSHKPATCTYAEPQESNPGPSIQGPFQPGL